MYKLLRFIKADRERIKSIFYAVGTYKWYYGKNYIFGIPKDKARAVDVVLTAHYDTVVKDEETKGGIFIDKRRGALFGAVRGDDRAGCYGIYQIITTSAVLPYVVLCDGEESGCIGAKEFIEGWDGIIEHLKCERFMESAKYYISLDRQGLNDAIFYTTESKPFTKFVESFGFKESSGTTSDIKHFEEEFEICGVNLSIGYFNNHTTHEILYKKFLERTITRVCGMLRKSVTLDAFKYEKKTFRTYSSYGSGQFFCDGEYRNWEDVEWDYKTQSWKETEKAKKKSKKKQENKFLKAHLDDDRENTKTYPCDMCGAETKQEELFNNRATYQALICNKCASSFMMGAL